MPIKIALTKGRVEQQVVPLLEASGIDCSGVRNKGRRLIFNEDPVYQMILVKGPDVLTYLNNGSVHLGIVGSDVLAEQGNPQYAMLDLALAGAASCSPPPVILIRSRFAARSLPPSIPISRSVIFKVLAKTLRSFESKGQWSWHR